MTARITLIAAFSLLALGCPKGSATVESGEVVVPGGVSVEATLDALDLAWSGNDLLEFSVGDTTVYVQTNQGGEDTRQVCLYTALLEAAPGELARVRLVQGIWNEAVASAGGGPRIEVDLWGEREVVQLVECLLLRGPRSDRSPTMVQEAFRVRYERLLRADPRARAYIESVADAR